MKRALLALTAAAAISCATTDPADSARAASDLARARGAAETAWARDVEEVDRLRQRTRELLAAPLTPESAAEIALLNEPGLRATLERVGIGQADLAQASRLSNLSISASWLDEEGGPGEKTTLHVGLDILDWLVTPLRKQFAEAELERVKLEVGQAILDSAASAKAALVRYQAAEQMAVRLRTIEQIESAAAEFTRKLHEAGNASALDLANVRAAWAQARADEAQARLEAIRRREEVQRALGLTGPDTQWTAVEELPAPLRHGGRRLRERLAAPRAHLDLGRDQLTDEIGLERRADRSGREFLEAVDETERLGVEDRELLLHRDREVAARIEPLPR